MKVTGQNGPRTSELSTGKTREAEQTKGRTDKHAKGATEGGRVAGNRTSLTMNKIREVIQNTPDVRSDRVEAVREQLRKGAFAVDAERLAESLLTASVREDLEKP